MQAEFLLSTAPEFSFLLRDSESTPQGYSLSIRLDNLFVLICMTTGDVVIGKVTLDQ